MIDTSDMTVIESDGNVYDEYTIKRFATGHNVNGRWVHGLVSAVEITASVQPFNSRQLLLLPEGKRDRGWVKVFTSTELTCLKGDGGKQEGDQILFKGFYYEIQTLDNWQKGITHYEYSAAKVNN